LQCFDVDIPLFTLSTSAKWLSQWGLQNNQ